MAVNIVYPRAQCKLFFRVLNAEGQVLGARTPEKEFWILTATKRPVSIKPSNRRLWLYKWIKQVLHFGHPLIDPQADFWTMTTLLFRIAAWLVFTGVDKSAEKYLRAAFRQSNLANAMKLVVEDLTGATWDWWPLPSSRQLFQKSDFFIEWTCVSLLRLYGDRREADVT